MHEADPGADDRDDRAGGRADRVGEDEPVGGDDARQRGRQRREIEAVDRECGQRGEGEQHTARAVVDQLRGGREDEERPHRGAVRQHPLPAPAVEQHAGERPDQAVGQEQDHEAGRNLFGPGVVFGVEQHGAGQAGLKQPVRGLRRQPGREQLDEPALAEQLAKRSRPAHSMIMAT